MSVKLEKPHCSEDPEVQSVLHHDCTVDGVTYRVWSAFLGRKRAEESLGELMLRQLERGDEKPAFDAKQTESESMLKSENVFCAVLRNQLCVLDS